MTNTAKLTAPSPRSAPIALWRALRALLATVCDLFGAPEAIAAQGALTRKLHSLILPWLRAGEALARRLILIEAQALASLAPSPAPNPRPRRAACAAHLRVDPAFAPDQPETWRVSLRLLERRPPRRRPRASGQRVRRAPIWTPFLKPERRTPAASAPARPRAPRAPAHAAPFLARLPAARPTAMRLEALLRACNDPLPHARRLARRLAAQPSRAPHVLAPLARVSVNLAGPALRRADKLAVAALAHPHNTS